MLVDILVVAHPLHLQTIVWTEQEAGTSACLIEIIGTTAIIGILQETVLTVIESCQRKSEAVAYLLIMADLSLTPETGTQREIDICSLHIERILRVHTNQSAFCIHTIQCSLRTTQHIHTVDIVQMEVECRLVLNRHPIDIDSHSRTVDARTDTTHINGRRQTAAIIGHRE